MKRFAITPDTCEPHRLVQQIARLPTLGVDCVYIRQNLPDDGIEIIIRAAGTAGMVPIIHHRRARACADLPCGLHVKSHERDVLAHVPRAGRIITAACHDAQTADAALRQTLADFVFISPVFQPHSKPHVRRPLFPLEDIKRLTRRYGERIVLLGGMNMQRISEMQAVLAADFSVAGISMFFPVAAEGAIPGMES